MSRTHDPIPTEIKLHQKSRSLEIVFDNGERFDLPCRYLRVFSTSAEAQTARERGEIVSGKENVNITKIEPVGSYAVNLHFDDGHTTGIFSWRTLYELGRDYDKNWQNYLTLLKQKGLAPKPAICPRPLDTAQASEGYSVTLRYFVSLVGKFGKESEEVRLPGTVTNVAALLEFLRKRGGVWEQSLLMEHVTITVNKQFAATDTPIHSGDEIAIVPKGR